MGTKRAKKTQRVSLHKKLCVKAAGELEERLVILREAMAAQADQLGVDCNMLLKALMPRSTTIKTQLATRIANRLEDELIAKLDRQQNLLLEAANGD